jgi:hypothetical protein
MLPGQSGLLAETILSRLKMFKAHNARGAHIYIRPAREHRFTVLDDLSQVAVNRLNCEGYEPCALVETSPENFQAWLKHDGDYPKPLSTFIAQRLAERFGGDRNAADWRRFGRLPGFTNPKPKYRTPEGLYPFVLLRQCIGEQYSNASFVRLELTKQFQLREHQEQERRSRFNSAFSPSRGQRYSHLSLERFRLSPKYQDRPAAADIAFCVAAFALQMPEEQIAHSLSADYLSRDPNPTRKAAYIGRTLTKARAWVER